MSAIPVSAGNPRPVAGSKRVCSGKLSAGRIFFLPPGGRPGVITIPSGKFCDCNCKTGSFYSSNSGLGTAVFIPPCWECRITSKNVPGKNGRRQFRRFCMISVSEIHAKYIDVPIKSKLFSRLFQPEHSGTVEKRLRGRLYGSSPRSIISGVR